MIGSLLYDLRYGARGLRKSPGYTVSAGLTLALSLGGTVAMFGVAYAALFRPLPFADERRLFRLQMSTEPAGRGVLTGLPPHAFGRVRDQVTSFARLAPQRFRDATIGGVEPEQVAAIEVGPDWLPTLGVAPARGRGFLPEEERAGAEARVVLVSHGFWQRRMGGRPDAVGATLRLDGAPMQVIGIMPADFNYPYGSDLWVPGTFEETVGQPGSLNVVGRLRPGVTPPAAAAELDVLARRLAAEEPGAYAGRGLVARPIRMVLVRDQGRVVLALLAAVALVLLVACANVATLTLARSQARMGELALRSALGASRGRQVRQLLAEGLVLAGGAGLVGLGLSGWLTGFLSALIPDGMTDVYPQARLTPVVLLFAAAASFVAAMLFALVPALRASRSGIANLLSTGSRAMGGPGRGRLMRVLIAGEVALVLSLLAGVAVMVQDFRRLLDDDLGFSPEAVVTIELALGAERYDDPRERVGLVDQLLARANALASVDTAAVTTNLPVVRENMLATMAVEAAFQRPDERLTVNHRLVSPGYFSAMGIPLQAGRDFRSADGRDAPGVAIVSEGLARRHWGAESPIGRRIKQGRLEDAEPWLTIVGVVGDVKEASEGTHTWYLPYAQGIHPSPVRRIPPERVILAARTRVGPAAAVADLRSAVRQVDPSLPVFDVMTMSERYAGTLAPRRLGTILGLGFGAIALLLGAVGIHGVVSYSMAQRTTEFGVRLAMGATPAALKREVLWREGLTLGLGTAAGLAGALAVTRLMGGLVVEAAPPGAGPLVGAVGLLAVVTAVAAYLPVRRAAQIHPMSALRGE